MRSAALSWERLNRDERTALASLAVFARPATIDAFEAVAGPRLKADSVEVAEALLRKGLACRLDAAGAERIHPTESLGLYARRMLDSCDLRERIEDAHAHYFLERAERASARSYGPHAERALDELQADAPDLLVAFASVRPRAPDRAARMALALGDLALFRGGLPKTEALTPGSTIFADARGAADASGDVELRARTRILEARIALEVGLGADAASSLLEAVALADGARLADVAADARRALGWAWLALGRKRESAAVLEEALKRHRETGNVRGEADALAARGLVACLDAAIDRASLDRGQRRLEVAHALHRGAGDALRRAKVVDMARLVGIELEAEPLARVSIPELGRLLRASAAEHRAAGSLWRESLDLLRLAELEEGQDARRVLLDTARRSAEEAHVPSELLAALARLHSDGERKTGAVARPWTIGPCAQWFCAPDGTPASLVRHGSMRRVLDALVASRHESPGVATTADTLLAIGWPGERLRYESGRLRVYTTIRRLRRLGLEGVLLTRDDGYLIDAHATFVREGDEGNSS